MTTENSKKLFNVNLYIEDLKTTILVTKQGYQCFSGMIHRNRVVALLEEALVNLKIQQDYINKINIANYELKTNSTTEINIDYYEELKAKADKWVKKETPHKVNLLYHDERDKKHFSCSCNAVVEEGENYCWNCGRRITFN